MQYHDNYLLNNLENQRNINISLISHNAYWPNIKRLEKHFNNCKVITFGGSINYIKNSDTKRIKELYNSHIIAFYNSHFYDNNDIEFLKSIAYEIVNNNHKNVGIGYLGSIKINDDIKTKINITYIDKEKTFNQEQILQNNITPYNLIENILIFIDTNSKNKTLKLLK